MRAFLTKLQVTEFGELSENFINWMERCGVVAARGLQAGEPLYTFSQLALLVFLERYFEWKLTRTEADLHGVARLFELNAQDKLNTVASICATTFICEGDRILALRGAVRTLPHPKMGDPLYFRPGELWHKIRQKLGRTKQFRDMLAEAEALHA